MIDFASSTSIAAVPSQRSAGRKKDRRLLLICSPFHSHLCLPNLAHDWEIKFWPGAFPASYLEAHRASDHLHFHLFMQLWWCNLQSCSSRKRRSRRWCCCPTKQQQQCRRNSVANGQWSSRLFYAANESKCLWNLLTNLMIPTRASTFKSHPVWIF